MPRANARFFVLVQDTKVMHGVRRGVRSTILAALLVRVLCASHNGGACVRAFTLSHKMGGGHIGSIDGWINLDGSMGLPRSGSPQTAWRGAAPAHWRAPARPLAPCGPAAQSPGSSAIASWDDGLNGIEFEWNAPSLVHDSRFNSPSW